MHGTNVKLFFNGSQIIYEISDNFYFEDYSKYFNAHQLIIQIPSVTKLYLIDDYTLHQYYLMIQSRLGFRRRSIKTS